MAADRKFGEGMEHVRQAEKCMKTSLFKWKPDFDGAASDYSNAATSFKNAKAYQQCKDCLLKAADCYQQNQSYFSSAKSLEQAALISKEMGDLNEAANLVEKACRLFQEHGSPDTGALTLEKGAKMIESKYPDRAVHLYKKAADVVMLEDRPRQAAEYIGKAARLLVKLRRYDDAVETIQREISLHSSSDNRAVAGRLAIALVLVHLTRGDSVAANKAFKETESFIEDDEVHILETLLEAYDEEDHQTVATVLNNPFIKHMDVEYAKLARDLHVPTSLKELNKATSGNGKKERIEELEEQLQSDLTVTADKSSPETSNSKQNENDDDEYEGGLC